MKQVTQSQFTDILCKDYNIDSQYKSIKSFPVINGKRNINARYNSIIVTAFQESNIYRITELKEVLDGIHPVNCWKYDYYCKENLSWSSNNVEKENLPDYDIPTAFIYYVMSNLRFLDNNHWNPQMPKVTKYPKADHVTIKSLNEHFGKIKSLT